MKFNSIIISAALLTMLSSCNGTLDRQQQSLEEVSKQELATALGERDQLLALVKEISVGLEQIRQLENFMANAATSPNELAGQKTRILADISKLKKKIQQRKVQLQELESKLKNSTINNTVLQETIHALRIQIDSQIDEIEALKRQLIAANAQIGELNDAVDSLNSTVSTITDERDVAQETSVRFENELNTCYYIIATKSDLKKHHIIESGFLRQTKVMKGDFDKNVFEVSDKRMLETLPLNTSKARILTNHPETSYEMTETDGKKIIKITDPDQFWSLTNYLVIQQD